MKPVRIGVLGCSRIARKSVFRAIQDSPYAELAMIGSRDAEVARTCAEEFGCGSGTYEDVLNNKIIDAVYLSLPNTEHEEWVLKAAQAQKHVWCEKPAALTYASAKRMVEECKKRSVRLMEGLMFRFHPQHTKVREFLDAGVIGESLRLDACFAFPMPKGGNILDKKLGGGAYYDACPYPIYAARMIFGTEPLSAICSVKMDEALGVPVRADMILEFPEGRSALVSSMFGSYYQSYYDILGTEGRIRTERAFPVAPDREVKLFLYKNDAIDEIPIQPADHFRIMVDFFCKEIALGSAGSARYEEDLLAQALVLEAGMKSYEEKRIVQLAELN